ncbi:MAG: tyrosine-type recombinase/integrase [Planctomycetaceae bacterium]|jgi:integrase|nr:tyrosine-type recombinase/integrase [Planctomycetaceae bacterium]
MKQNSKLPKYCRRPDHDSAFFWWKGKKVYLPGAFGSEESLSAYNREMAKISLARASGQEQAVLQPHNVTIAILVAAFLDWGDTYYLKDGKPTGTNQSMFYASAPLVELFGSENTDDFSPQKLEILQQAFVRSRLSRKECNRRIQRIIRIFKWGVPRNLVTAGIVEKLQYVERIAKGKTTARETGKRQPVSDAVVDAVIPHLPRVVAAMVTIQRETGMRPGELFRLTWSQIDQSDPDCWLYFPDSHKTDYRDIEKAVPLNRKCREVLANFPDEPDAIIFSPRKTVRETIRTKEESLIKKRIAKTNEQYNRTSYRHAVQRACEKAGVPKWTPYQLRHSLSSDVKHTHGEDAARAILGHADKLVENYNHRDIELMKQVIKERDGIQEKGD